MIRRFANGNIMTIGGLPSCTCCPELELEIMYDWRGTGMIDLDTGTSAFGENVGYSCGFSGDYVVWLPGSGGIAQDDVSEDGFERVNVKVDQARLDSLWGASVNIECAAGWYIPQEGSGSALLVAAYKGVTKQVTISPGEQNFCASTPVATITVYHSSLPDGSFFEIL